MTPSARPALPEYELPAMALLAVVWDVARAQAAEAAVNGRGDEKGTGQVRGETVGVSEQTPVDLPLSMSRRRLAEDAPQRRLTDQP